MIPFESAPSDIDVSKLSLKLTPHPKTLIPNNELIFGHSFTDHMLSIKWTAKNGWSYPSITPYQNLSLDPASCVFHYAFECFEGMKAYKDRAGNLRLFRPFQNMARMKKSAARIALPTFDESSVVDLISKLKKEYSLYIRPTIIGTQSTLGVGAPSSALLFVIASPVGPYYPTGFKAISLEATDYAVRAWPGGVGDKKLGANYAPCILHSLKQRKRGFQQNLWLFGSEEYITEVGTMNMFVVIRDKDTGKKELITAPLDGTILEGVTRDSILSLARERLLPEEWTISERNLSMHELFESSKEGRLLRPLVRNISWKGRIIDCGLKSHQEAGHARQYGEEDHEWSYIIPQSL
ncbi:Branched-chain-amino-acid aminotransferase, cytosolic [Erysiphe necator]|nr:Branched-chain-amino-acid aminotransferase, cytosolic [Erysiphe necator]